jgi:NAD-specific glutamate dehydrogenase
MLLSSATKMKKKTNKHIATLLEGKSESQIKYHSASLIEKGTLKTVAKTIAKNCLWTEEEDAIIISNKNEKKRISISQRY